MSAVALLSGGLDSTVAAAAVARESGLALALTFDYGQRAARREEQAAAQVAAALGVPQRVVRLDFLAELTATALVNRARDVPAPAAADLDDRTGAAERSMRSVWVPNRNGVFIAIAASFAEALGAGAVVVGFNREEAATFPDNSVEFLERAGEALRFSTLSKVRVLSPTSKLEKSAIVRLGYALGAPMRHVWSCYEGAARPCGRCESCLRLARALDGSGFRDRFEREVMESIE